MSAWRAGFVYGGLIAGGQTVVELLTGEMNGLRAMAFGVLTLVGVVLGLYERDRATTLDLHPEEPRG